MARSKAFDVDEVIQAARDVFWVAGYDAAAMPELERATGLGRSSIYNAFGSKRGLFDAAVQSYLDQVVRPRLEVLVTARDGAAGLGAYFDSLADAVCGEVGPQRGCLLLTASSGRNSRDEAVRTAMEAYRVEVTGAFAAALRRDLPAPAVDQAPPEGPDTQAETRIDERARLLFALLTAGMTLARINPVEAEATLRSAAAFSTPAHAS
ncbi:MAG: TetR/AcrR family transcriptional regulator [Arthrobacter sp.]|uniref:TetR/AcrR family transcriptional regulator n=1 Tax=Arthrobacter sp. AOP36-A1-22 TaxID=3457684 RepID=UPI0026562937|nr:TetR/AcrR family transcriptional regulator [Micrococcaceae bacterium]MDN5888022.1 TetR/AcrR family transcriptional regulator [Micrococcaceae bacterium]MDN6169376.1 TetR/AcrR family transcriptional regulator [Micrococcaceae bacterium]MDN6298769.1 TetR/AcrR family transcriptional regulator [Micrococcaceae bacterium]